MIKVNEITAPLVIPKRTQKVTNPPLVCPAGNHTAKLKIPESVAAMIIKLNDPIMSDNSPTHIRATTEAVDK